jgi:hypothetical protein
MKTKPLPRVPIMAALIHATLVIGGLLASTFLRPHGTDSVGFLWAGALIGTALGQILALARLRSWLVAVLMISMVWFGAFLLPYGWNSWDSLEVAVMAFLPAIVCGYASLSERGAVIAFWFPAVLFVLPILEGAPSRVDAETEKLVGADGTWLLLTALSVLFLAFLRARETRRVAIWQRVAAVRLSAPKPAAVLKVAPLRSLSQWGFVAVTGVAALTITSLVAPYLWQKEELGVEKGKNAPSAKEADLSLAYGQPSGTSWAGEPLTQAVCCPDVAPAPAIAKERYKEYFPVHATTHEGPPASSQPAGCVVCGHDAAPPAQVAYGASVAQGGPQVAPQYAPPAGGSYDLASPYAPSAPTHPNPPTATPPPQPTPHAGPSPVPLQGDVPELRGRSASHAPRATLSGVPEEKHPLRWFLSSIACILGFELLLRPFRRLLTLRHLRSPLWRETIDQRVSNLWQLALIGLRDAGVCTATGEQPEELARRAAVPGMETCATVLERARHGVRVDAEDLDVMSREATTTYSEARKRVGFVPRAASWLRWPLV